MGRVAVIAGGHRGARALALAFLAQSLSPNPRVFRSISSRRGGIAFAMQCIMSLKWLRVCAAVGLVSATVAACGGSSTSGLGSGGSAGVGAAGSGAGGSGAVGGGGNGGGGTGGVGGIGGPNRAACNTNDECRLLPTNCCGYCGEAKIEGFIAVNEKYLSEVYGELCADPVACPDCVEYPKPNLVALCEQGQCQPRDLRQMDFSSCNTKDDCVMRWGSDCCEGCGGHPLEIIGLNKNTNWESEICGGPSPCDACVPQPFPPDAILDCLAGHCIVQVTQN